MSIFRNRDVVKFTESAPYQKADGRWYVLVTIDNTSEIEQPISPPEPVPAPAINGAAGKPKGKPQ